jgi:hypothetical protein
VESTVHVDGEAAGPISGIVELHPSDRTGHAGIVHQHVDGGDRTKIGLDGFGIGDVELLSDQSGASLAGACKRGGIDVADRDPVASLGEGPRDGQADAGSAGGHQHVTRRAHAALLSRAVSASSTDRSAKSATP